MALNEREHGDRADTSHNSHLCRIERCLMSWLKRYWYVGAFVIVNLAIASPAAAGWDDDWCEDGQGGQEKCCRSCWIFCECEFL